MIIKEAKYKKVRKFVRQQISPEAYGCDHCKKEIKEFPNEANRLEITVWAEREDHNGFHYHFCSWSCVLKFIPTIKSNYFASLPYLYFDERNGKRTSSELLKLLSKKK